MSKRDDYDLVGLGGYSLLSSVSLVVVSAVAGRGGGGGEGGIGAGGGEAGVTPHRGNANFILKKGEEGRGGGTPAQLGRRGRGVTV